MHAEDRRVARSGRCFETIAKCLEEPVPRQSIGIDIHETTIFNDICAKIVDTVNMVSMRMCINSRIEAVCACVNHLSTEIRPGIDHNCRAVTCIVKSLNQ